MQETWKTEVQSLGREGPLEEGKATHSGILAYPWTEEPDGVYSTGLQRIRHDLNTEHTGTPAWENEDL